VNSKAYAYVINIDLIEKVLANRLIYEIIFKLRFKSQIRTQISLHLKGIIICSIPVTTICYEKMNKRLLVKLVLRLSDKGNHNLKDKKELRIILWLATIECDTVH